MAAAQPSPDAAIGVGNSLAVTATAYNRVVFWLQMARTGDRWRTAPSGPDGGPAYPGLGVGDPQSERGSSAITETLGIGGFAMPGPRRHHPTGRRHARRRAGHDPADSAHHAGAAPERSAATPEPRGIGHRRGAVRSSG